jgi:hypothetical protein
MDKKKLQQNDDEMFALPQENLKWIGIGFLMVVIGFFLVSGGGSDDPNVFSYEIFNFRRIVLAPLVMLFGYLFVIYAIMRKPKNKE